MYGTAVPVDDSYALMDDALIRLRRLWSGTAPGASAVGGQATPVEMSTVLVVNAIHLLQVARPDAEVSVADVAEGLDVASSTASRLVNRAVASSMVARAASTVDTRRAALTLTPQGQVLLREAASFRRSYLDQMLDGWTETETATFATLLDRFATTVHQRPPTPASPKEQSS